MGDLTVIPLALVLASALQVQAQDSPRYAVDTVVVHSDGLALRAALWRPAGHGPFPAVLFNHGGGTAPDPRRPALLGRTFARHGYVFLYLYRPGAGLSADQGSNDAALLSRAQAERGIQGRNEVQLQLLEAQTRHVAAAHAFLQSRPEVDARRIAVAGHSFGGQLALLLAERDTTLRAAIAFGAAALSWNASPPLQKRLLVAAARTRVPVFFIHAANDFSTAPGKALAAEMTRLGKPNRLRVYPAIGNTTAAGHDFVHLAVRTWQPDVFAFLDAHMRK